MLRPDSHPVVVRREATSPLHPGGGPSFAPPAPRAPRPPARRSTGRPDGAARFPWALPLVLAAVLLAVAAAGPRAGVAQEDDGGAATLAPLHTIPSDLELRGDPVFTADGKRFAYAAEGGGRRWVVVDGTRGEGTAFRDSPVFSADGKHVAYRAGKRVSATAEQWWIVLDGRALATHDWVGPPALSATTGKVAYWAGTGVKVSADGPYEGGQYFVVFGKKPGVVVAGGMVLDPPVISSDGGKVGYVARDGHYWQVVAGKTTSPRYALAGRPAFGPNGRRFAYPAFENARWFLVDHKDAKGKGFDFVGTPVFAPKGERVACRVKTGGKWFVAVNGQTQGKGYDSIGDPHFGPDGKQIAYRANQGGESPYQPLPGMPGPPPGTEDDVTGGKWIIVVGRTPASEAFVDAGDPVFGPGAKSLAFAAFDGRSWRVVVDHRTGDPHDWVSRPVYSTDGRSVSYGARDGKQLRWMTMPVD